MSDVIVNYLIVQISIILFMLPFYLWYSHKKPPELDHAKDINHKLELFFSSKQANYLVFFWAMGEALVWFVIPEFLLLLVVFMRIKNKSQMVIWDIYGTAAGVLLAFLIKLPRDSISNLPYIQPKMVSQVEAWYEQSGIFGLVHQPFSGVPFKVFTHLAPEQGYFILWFLIFAIIVRIARYVVLYGIFVSIYPILHRFVLRNYIKLFFVATFIFSLMLLKVYNSYG